MSIRSKNARVSARSVCLLAVLALLALQWAWPGRVLPQPPVAGLVLAIAMSLPLAALGLGLWRERPSARFWSGVAALFYFCHGIADAWAIPEARMAGLLEALLGVIVVVASSWEGLRARFGAKGRGNV